MSDWGCLLINLGTPKTPAPRDVRAYLTEFLLDPEVIDIPWIARQFLVRFVIAPTRAPKSGALYETIWTDRGSPLHFNSRDLRDGVAKTLGQVPVQFAFRYGDPSIQNRLEEMRSAGVRRLVVLPLYPQYSTSATRSVRTELERQGAFDLFDELIWIGDFYDQDFYIESEVQLIQKFWRPGSHLLLSFHSLPVRQITKNHAGCDACFERGPCDHQGEAGCYRRQCQITAKLIANRLGLKDGDWSLGYQSRLGRAEWLRPSTPDKVSELRARGIKDLTVANPGFMADCLETIEEIGGQLREQFLNEGGEKFARVPCLNADPVWVEKLSSYLQKQISEGKNGKTPS